MKTKNILLGMLSFLTFATYAQTEKKQTVEPKRAVTELKIEIESEDLDGLTNFDWNTVNETFKGNNPNQEITLIFAYSNKSKNDKSDVKVDNLEFKVTGRTSDLDKLISRLQNSFKGLSEIEGSNKN